MNPKYRIELTRQFFDLHSNQFEEATIVERRDGKTEVWFYNDVTDRFVAAYLDDNGRIQSFDPENS